MPIRLIGEPYLWYPERARKGSRRYKMTMLQDAYRRGMFVSRTNWTKEGAGTGRFQPRPKH